MLLSAHQPAYLPWPGYFDKIERADAFVILDDVQFSTGENFVNRNRIKGVNGKPQWLTIPLKMHGHMGKTIREMDIDDSKFWRMEHWRKIVQSYSDAPFYVECCPMVSDGTSIECLSDQWMPFPHKVHLQSGMGISGKGNQLILNLCHVLGADSFLFGAMGRNYCDFDLFKANGITPIFQDFHCPVYPQINGPFVPNLSIIDMLFNVGIEETKRLLNL
jgi:hypothetical protein